MAAAGYVPRHRLDRAEIREFFRAGGVGSGQRSVAGYDEDTTTMGQAATQALLSDLSPAASDVVSTVEPITPGEGQGKQGTLMPSSLWFSTTTPAYLDKNNSSIMDAALDMHAGDPIDVGGALRSGPAMLRTALASQGGPQIMAVATDMRTGLPTSDDEALGGDGAAAVLIRDDSEQAPVIAQYIGGACASSASLERWRLPDGSMSTTWEERLGELFAEWVLEGPVQTANIQAEIINLGVQHIGVTGMNARLARAVRKKLHSYHPKAAFIDIFDDTVGTTGTAHMSLMLCAALERAQPGEVIMLVSVDDGADVVILQATNAIANFKPMCPVSAQVAAGKPVSYGRFLAWREMVQVQPPNRPAPTRPSTPAVSRQHGWKYGLRARKDPQTQVLQTSPQRTFNWRESPEMRYTNLATQTANVRSFAVDRLAYSPNPPVIMAVLDFDGGECMPMELTDVSPDEVVPGMQVEPTFRRMYTAEGVHNYFWKARPVL